jgi:hypothetical protein
MDLIRDMYLIDSQYFIDNKNKQPLTVLIDLLKIFKEKIKGDKNENESISE